VGDGRFVVQATFSLTGGGAPEADGRILSFPTTYFPSASSASEAAAVTVGSGEVRADVDIALALQPTTTISGRLMGPEGPAANYALHLVPSDTGGLSADPDVATAITDQDGGTYLFESQTGVTIRVTSEDVALAASSVIAGYLSYLKE